MAETWVARWADGRVVEIELEREPGSVRWGASALGADGCWSSTPEAAIRDWYDVCRREAQEGGADELPRTLPSEILPAGEPTRAELLADLARLRAIEAAAKADIAARGRWVSALLYKRETGDDGPLETAKAECDATSKALRAALAGKGGA
jgi:hypothetical protein